jgi:hypothetical protein
MRVPEICVHGLTGSDFARGSIISLLYMQHKGSSQARQKAALYGFARVASFLQVPMSESIKLEGTEGDS